MILYQRTLIVSTTKKTHWATSTGDLKAEQRAGLFARSGTLISQIEIFSLRTGEITLRHTDSGRKIKH